MSLRSVIVTLLIICFACVAQAATDLSGTWAMNAKKGENLGMMAALKETLVVKQTAEQMTFAFTDVFQGNTTTRQVSLDLTGAAVDNHTAMGSPSKTESKWDAGNLVTIWTTPSAIPGTEVVRTETHSLSDDGAVMTLTIERANKPNMVLVYEKQ